MYVNDFNAAARRLLDYSTGFSTAVRVEDRLGGALLDPIFDEWSAGSGEPNRILTDMVAVFTSDEFSESRDGGQYHCAYDRLV